MPVSAQDIAKLREKTGLSIMECKKALEEAGGDEDKAMELLRKRGVDKAAKKADRETNMGIVEAYSHGGKIGVLVEVLCETDFVVRNEEFKALAHDIALQIAAMSPRYIAPENIPADELADKKKEFEEEAKAGGKPENVVEKIATGKLEKYYSEVCLLNQPFIKDQDMTIADLITQKIAKIGERIVVSRFTRYELGEAAE